MSHQHNYTRIEGEEGGGGIQRDDSAENLAITPTLVITRPRVISCPRVVGN